MEVGISVLLITVLVAGGFLIAVDAWLAIRGGYDATMTAQVRRASRNSPVIPLLVGLVIGLLLGHLFWGG